MLLSPAQRQASFSLGNSFLVAAAKMARFLEQSIARRKLPSEHYAKWGAVALGIWEFVFFLKAELTAVQLVGCKIAKLHLFIDYIMFLQNFCDKFNYCVTVHWSRQNSTAIVLTNPYLFIATHHCHFLFVWRSLR